MMGPVVTVVTDDEALRSSLEGGLRERGFDIVSLPDDDQWSRAPLARKPSTLVLDAAALPYGATELAEQLRVWLEDRCPALVCVGEPEEPPRDSLFDAQVARGAAATLVADLAQLLPRLTAVSGVALRSDVQSAIDDEAAG
ncbi:MAG: hypothetical protein RLO52_05305 [Sandaracinaceae bacterium]|nr:MAG: hypothetical protein EVA89_22270 [Sandaracinaceae bacterium]